MPVDVGEGASYPTLVGLVYVFNLIIGTGALALPKAFQEAGYALGIAVLITSCMVSFICATFVVESMACANAVIQHRRIQKNEADARRRASIDDEDRPGAESQPLLHSPSDQSTSLSVKGPCYDINERVELSQMAQMFLGKIGLVAAYIILTVYLFGDLTIYSAAVPKSFMNVLCSGGLNKTNASFLAHDAPCHDNWPAFFTRFTIYRFVVVAFTLLVGPMVFIGMTKTKYLQFVTTVFRWAAFLLMIGMASEFLSSHGPAAHPPPTDLRSFGSLFGVTVYAFMCHHSLPGLITPMKQKRKIFQLLFVVFLLILMFYLALSLTGAFAFADVQDVYTLNFLNSDPSNVAVLVIDYSLALFPVFTISTNFPIVGITLKNNLNTLITLISDKSSEIKSPRRDSVASLIPRGENEVGTPTTPADEDAPKKSRQWLSHVLVPLVVVLLPATIALLTDDVTLLAAITGSFPGVGVQFVLPSVLVIWARRRSQDWLGQPIPATHASPLRGILWPVIMLGWSLFTVAVVTVNLFQKKH